MISRSLAAVTELLSDRRVVVLSLITLTATDMVPDRPATGAAVASATVVICEAVRDVKSTLSAEI